MFKLLKLSFLPKSPDFGLLILRVILGFSMLLLHGRAKLLNFSSMAEKFAILPGVPGHVNLGLAIFAEVVCSALLIAGLFTRFAALVLAITMGVAFFTFHKSALVDATVNGVAIKSGELAMVYLVAYVTLLFAGAGKFSVDRD